MNEEKRQLAEMDKLVIQNLDMLAHAMSIASEARFMSHEHAKTIWKEYLKISGMDIPKNFNTKKGK